MKFQINRTYKGRSIGDADCIILVHVAKRTAKTLTTTEGKTLRISVDYLGNENVKPWGSYSMAPSISAEKVI